MKLIFFALFAILAILLTVSCVSASPTRDKRYDMYNPYAGGYAYAGPYGGAYAGAGAGFWPFGGFPFFNPYVGPIVWPVAPKPWYLGENVCATTKIIEEPSEIKEFLGDGSFEDFSRGDFEHMSKTCRGGNTKYACCERVTTNEGSKIILTKYQCCHGFVRCTDGRPGCEEKPAAQQVPSGQATPAPPTPSPMKLKDKLRYTFIQSSSGSQSQTGVEKVPPA